MTARSVTGALMGDPGCRPPVRRLLVASRPSNGQDLESKLHESWGARKARLADERAAAMNRRYAQEIAHEWEPSQ